MYAVVCVGCVCGCCCGGGLGVVVVLPVVVVWDEVACFWV